MSKINYFVLGLISVFCLNVCSSVVHAGQVTGSMSASAIAERLKPVGQVKVSGEVIQAKTDVVVPIGQKVYEQACAVCHASGLAGAPKHRDAAAWEKRLVVGMEAVLQSAIKGKGAMPPRGTCFECSDEDLLAAIKYMVAP